MEENQGQASILDSENLSPQQTDTQFNAVSSTWAQFMAHEVADLLAPDDEHIKLRQDNAHQFFIEMITEMVKITGMPRYWLIKAEEIWQALMICPYHDLARSWIEAGLNAYLSTFVKAMQEYIRLLDHHHAQEVITFMQLYMDPSF